MIENFIEIKKCIVPLKFDHLKKLRDIIIKSKTTQKKQDKIFARIYNNKICLNIAILVKINNYQKSVKKYFWNIRKTHILNNNYN